MVVVVAIVVLIVMAVTVALTVIITVVVAIVVIVVVLVVIVLVAVLALQRGDESNHRFDLFVSERVPPCRHRGWNAVHYGVLHVLDPVSLDDALQHRTDAAFAFRAVTDRAVRLVERLAIGLLLRSRRARGAGGYGATGRRL